VNEQRNECQEVNDSGMSVSGERARNECSSGEQTAELVFKCERQRNECSRGERAAELAFNW
jgi:hypothetical protein